MWLSHVTIISQSYAFSGTPPDVLSAVDGIQLVHLLHTEKVREKVVSVEAQTPTNETEITVL